MRWVFGLFISLLFFYHDHRPVPTKAEKQYDDPYKHDGTVYYCGTAYADKITVSRSFVLENYVSHAIWGRLTAQDPRCVICQMLFGMLLGI